MDVTTTSWEYPLLALAHEAQGTHASSLPFRVAASSGGYEDAYAYCARVVKNSSRTFHLAAGLLPREKRQAAHALYAFCRATDDLMDASPDGLDVAYTLEGWRARLQSPPSAYDPVLLAWADTQARYRIPHGYVAQLIDGIARDLEQERYATFADLAAYCYGVASTVGLMVMHIIGFESESAVPYAIKLGIALQLTNILRDVGADWQTGRLYLPQDELAQFGVTESNVARGAVTERWRSLMRHQIQRTRQLYHEALPGIALLHAEGRFAIQTAAGLYQAILDDIEAHDYDVFRRRAHIGLWGKTRRLPGLWWKTMRLPLPAEASAR
jgi:phytoene synthase